MRGFTPIILIAIAVGIFFFYTDPQYQKIKAHREEAVKYDEVLAQAAQLKILRTNLEDKLNKFSQADLDRLSKLIPEKVDHARLILDVDGIASKYAIDMKGIVTTDPISDTDPTGTKKMYKETSLSFTFQSSYENMLLFIKDLEQSLRMVDVVSITLAQGNPQLPIYNFTIKLQAYWLDLAKIEATAGSRI